MDKAIKLIERGDIHDFFYRSWETNEFRRSHEEGGYIYQKVDAVADHPLLVTNIREAYERSHFLALIGVLPLRPGEYDGRPHIADLFIEHEIEHIGDLKYTAKSEDEFVHYVWDNELVSSLGSEVIVYFAIDGLRANTFPFEIWFDRFERNDELLDPDIDDNRHLFHADRERFMHLLMARRQRAMDHPIPGDANEQLIAKYHASNVVWGEVWGPNWSEVVTNMSNFRIMAQEDRQGAADFLEDWVLRLQGTHPCPYHEEAVQFDKVVRAIYS